MIALGVNGCGGPGYSSEMIRDHLVCKGFNVVEVDDPAEVAADRPVLGWFPWYANEFHADRRRRHRVSRHRAW